jgi:hypothetical protein
MINIRLAAYVTSLACATAFIGCGDDDDDDENGRDAAVTGGRGGTAGGGGRAGTGGRGGRGGAGGTAGEEDAGAEQDAGRDGNGDGNGNGDAAPRASAAIIAFEDTPGIVGTAEFVQTGSDVTLTLALMNCPPGLHAVHIHEGMSCENSRLPGPHWAVPRGVGIPPVTCAQDTGSIMYTRLGLQENTAWSIGGDPATNILGHVLVVHDQAGIPIACGVIMQAN